MVDFRWMSKGGLLLDGDGDIAVTSAATLESIVDLVRTRLKAAYDGWQLYRIGADLEANIGQINTAELEIKVRRQAAGAIGDILPAGAYEVLTLRRESDLTVLVYLQGTLIAQTTLSLQKTLA